MMQHFMTPILRKISEITYLQAQYNYTLIHFTDGSYELSSYTLKRFEEVLENNPSFYRYHRGFIVNKNFISKETSFAKNKRQLQLRCGTIIPVSRRR